MKPRYWALSLAMLFGISSKAHAQQEDSSSFAISAQLRPRAEFRSGAFRPLLPGEDPAALVSSRQRLSLDYRHKDLLDLRLSLQNVSVWGQANAVMPVERGGNAVGIFEAYGEVKIAGGLRTRFGRQGISLDDERIFGVVDWAQGARAHDALAFIFRKNGLEGRLYLAYNQNYKTNYDNNINDPAGNRYATADAQAYKTLQALWGKFPVGKNGYLSVLGMNTGLQNALSDTVSKDVHQQQTVGVNYFRNTPVWSVGISGFYQAGKNLTGASTSAFLLAAKMSAPFRKRWEGGLGADYLSGNDFGKANSENRAFAVPYATNHKFYGHMDYFYAGSPHGNVGLLDVYASLGFKASAKTRLNLTGHWFNATADIYRMNAKQSADLGQEADLSFSWKAYPFLELLGGYSVYHTTESLRLVKNTARAGDWQHWAWLSASLNLELLRTRR